ncbi:iron chelate uptake ABC transporter family permease subunit, partial [Fusobacterium sp.]
PHMARMIIGSDHLYLLPFSSILGAIVLVLADTISRTLFAPIEIPAGIVMAVIGVPFFLYLLRKTGD